MSAEALTVTLRLARPPFLLDVDEKLCLAGTTAVFGPSGSGKSTLLRALAGFETPASGRIAAGEQVWFDGAAGVRVPAHRRPVGFMFQDARLFPHLDVAGNLGFAVRRRGAAATGPGYRDVVDALDLTDLLGRQVNTLSGGERQRVALGRTLLTGPSLLLLDEPLAALDRQRKAEILPYLERVPRQFRIPTLYVSHDIDEVARLADRVLVLAAGRVQMHDATAAVLERLDLEPWTGRFEAGVLLTGRVTRHDPRLHLTHVEVQGQQIAVPLARGLPPGDTVRLRIRARDVALAIRPPEGLSIRNVLAGTLAELTGDPDTGYVEAFVDLRGARIRARITRAAVEALDLAPGMGVFALVKSVSFERGD